MAFKNTVFEGSGFVGFAVFVVSEIPTAARIRLVKTKVTKLLSGLSDGRIQNHVYCWRPLKTVDVDKHH